MFLRQLKPFEAFTSFRFKDPDTGYEHTGRNFRDLLKNIISYRAQNLLEPIEELASVVETHICGFPENCNKCKPMELHRSFYTTIKAGIILIKKKLFKEYVSQEVADRRADQCIRCPHNVFPDKDEFVKWADENAIEMIGARRSKHHDILGNCGACGCPLRAKVFLGGKFPKFKKHEVEQMKKVGCWQLRESGQE